MSNLKTLRKLVSDAHMAGEPTIAIPVSDAEAIVREAEAMHGGNNDGQTLRDQAENAELASIDKVAALLPGGGG